MEEFWIARRMHTHNFTIANHYEHCYQVVFVLQGKVRYTVGEKAYNVDKGSMIILSTLEDHSLEVLEYPYERYIFQINPNYFQREIKSPEIISIFIKRPVDFSHQIFLPSGLWDFLYQVLLEIEEEYQNKRAYWEKFIASDLYRMFIRILRECGESFAADPSDSNVIIAYKAMNYLERHYTENITVDEIAKELFLNKHYVSHVFKKITGFTLIEYVTALRINHAKVLLSETDQGVSDIAVECGYSDFSYFSKLFKKKVGESPVAFRKNCNQKIQ